MAVTEATQPVGAGRGVDTLLRIAWTDDERLHLVRATRNVVGACDFRSLCGAPVDEDDVFPLGQGEGYWNEAVGPRCCVCLDALLAMGDGTERASC